MPATSASPSRQAFPPFVLELGAGRLCRETTPIPQLFGMTCYTMMLARAHLAHHGLAGATEVVDASLRFAERKGERAYEPEFYRLKGEIMLARPGRRRPTKDAAEAFERALAVAAERKGLLFGLRAATSLCRVVRAPARPRRAEIVARFDPADDGPNLRAARRLAPSYRPQGKPCAGSGS